MLQGNGSPAAIYTVSDRCFFKDSIAEFKEKDSEQ